MLLHRVEDFFPHTAPQGLWQGSGHSTSSPGLQGNVLPPAKLLWQGQGLRLSQGFMGRELSQEDLEAPSAP